MATAPTYKVDPEIIKQWWKGGHDWKITKGDLAKFTKTFSENPKQYMQVLKAQGVNVPLEVVAASKSKGPVHYASPNASGKVTKTPKEYGTMAKNLVKDWYGIGPSDLMPGNSAINDVLEYVKNNVGEVSGPSKASFAKNYPQAAAYFKSFFPGGAKSIAKTKAPTLLAQIKALCPPGGPARKIALKMSGSLTPSSKSGVKNSVRNI
jgi:hypothetical protein